MPPASASRSRTTTSTPRRRQRLGQGQPRGTAADDGHLGLGPGPCRRGRGRRRGGSRSRSVTASAPAQKNCWQRPVPARVRRRRPSRSVAGTAATTASRSSPAVTRSQWQRTRPYSGSSAMAAGRRGDGGTPRPASAWPAADRALRPARVESVEAEVDQQPEDVFGDGQRGGQARGADAADGDVALVGMGPDLEVAVLGGRPQPGVDRGHLVVDQGGQDPAAVGQEAVDAGRGRTRCRSGPRGPRRSAPAGRCRRRWGTPGRPWSWPWAQGAGRG